MSCGKRDWTPQELIAFEEEIKDLFLAKRIRAPIHLSKGNEEQLIQIFREVKEGDWVLSTHRSHYHALLHGISPEWLRAEILAGRSMHINSPEHNFLTSAIVGGIAPIAVGVALGIKLKAEDRRVWAFLGDMAAEMGIVHEAIKYAKNFNLPVCFCIEDNGYSTNTPTREAWGISSTPPGGVVELERWGMGKLLRYSYERAFPHTGCSIWVNF